MSRTEVDDALRQWKKTGEASDWQKYAMSTVTWLLSPQHTSMHWFCTQNQQERNDALASITMLSYDPQPGSAAYPEFIAYFNAFRECLRSCGSCATCYQQGQGELFDRLTNDLHFPDTAVRQFWRRVQDLDRKRLLEVISDPKAETSDLLIATTELLFSVGCLSSGSFLSTIREKDLWNRVKKDLEPLLPLFAPGYIILLFSNDLDEHMIGLRHISVKARSCLVRKWDDVCSKLLGECLQKYQAATKLADMAWYCGSIVLESLGPDAPQSKDVVREIMKRLTIRSDGPSGWPMFGAQRMWAHVLGVKMEMSEEWLAVGTRYVCRMGPKLELGLLRSQGIPNSALNDPGYQTPTGDSIRTWLLALADRTHSLDIMLVAISFVIGLTKKSFCTVEDWSQAVEVAIGQAVASTEMLAAGGYQIIAQACEQLPPKFLNQPDLLSYELKNNPHKPCIFFVVAEHINSSLGHSHDSYISNMIHLLTGSGSIALFCWPQHIRRDSPVTSEEEIGQPSPLEPAEQVMLSLLNDMSGKVAESKAILGSKRAYSTLVLLSCSVNPRLASAARSVLREAFSARDDVNDDDDGFVTAALGVNPLLVIQDAVDLLKNSHTEARLPLLRGIFMHAQAIIDVLFDPLRDLDESVFTSLNCENLVIELWTASWQFVGFVFDNLRVWAQYYRARFLKSLVEWGLDFCQALIAKFRLVEASLATNSKDSSSWGNILAGPAAATVPQMRHLLALAFESLLVQAHDLIVDLLTLMRSFKAPVPRSVLEQLEGMATRQVNSKLTVEQLESLLRATHHYSEDEISCLMKGKPLSSMLQKAETSPSSTQLLAKQRQVTDFFRSGKNAPVQPSQPRDEPGNHKLSQMEVIRQQMTANRNQTKAKVSEVHPARPAGFNPRHDASASSTALKQRSPPLPHEHGPPNQCQDDGDSDGETALELMGKKLRTLPSVSRIAPSMHPRRQKTPSELDIERKRMTARLVVDAIPLHEAILQWDFLEQGSQPPGFSAERRKVPDKLSSVREYCQVMEPLLHLEAWQQILRAKIEPERPFILTVGRRVGVDQFSDVYATVSESMWSESRAGDGDLLVLSYDPQNPKPEKPLRPTSNPGAIVALARVKERSISRQRGNRVDLQLRMCPPMKMLPYLGQGRIMHVMRVCSLTTIEREFCALRALEYYDLKAQILSAEPSPITPAAAVSPVADLQQCLGLNESQARAVRQATTASGFSLIQGPPGTGKTKTILGILAALFSQSSGASLDGERARRVLVCAPSNAAVDEIVSRLKQGVSDMRGGIRQLRVVRLGRPEAINQQVRDLSLEELVNKEVSRKAEPVDAHLRQELNDVRQRLSACRKRLERMEQTGENPSAADEEERRQLTAQTNEAKVRFDLAREQQVAATRQRDIELKKVQQRILESSEVLCTTLSGSAHSLLASLELWFPTVLIDEAAQCVELSALIPLKYGCKRCIMVGDPKQLPPTVISQEAARLRYDQSLFVRMFKQNPTSVCMLDTQFRMHPDIARFPSHAFYNDKLLTAPEMAKKTQRVWHADPVFGPYRFFAISGRQERTASKSLANVAEAEAAVSLVAELLGRYGVGEGELSFQGEIGVISPYKEQVRVLRDKFLRRFGQKIHEIVDFNTVDGFQGQEKDIIVMSCVRATTDIDGVGFLGDTRRMNVAVTRARASMWILGHPAALQQNEVWRRLLDDARIHKDFFSTSKPRDVYAVARVEAKKMGLISSKHQTQSGSSSENSGDSGNDHTLSETASDMQGSARHQLPQELVKAPQEQCIDRSASAKLNPTGSTHPPNVADVLRRVEPQNQQKIEQLASTSNIVPEHRVVKPLQKPGQQATAIKRPQASIFLPGSRRKRR